MARKTILSMVLKIAVTGKGDRGGTGVTVAQRSNLAFRPIAVTHALFWTKTINHNYRLSCLTDYTRRLIRRLSELEQQRFYSEYDDLDAQEVLHHVQDGTITDFLNETGKRKLEPFPEWDRGLKALGINDWFYDISVPVPDLLIGLTGKLLARWVTPLYDYLEVYVGPKQEAYLSSIRGLAEAYLETHDEVGVPPSYLCKPLLKMIHEVICEPDAPLDPAELGLSEPDSRAKEAV